MLEINKIYNQDCLEGMKQIDDKSIDMILCDLPYGTTQCKWDSIIPFNKYIEVENKKRGKIVMYEDDYILNELKTTNKSYEYLRDEFKENCNDGLWDCYNRIIKDNGVIVLFADEPFSSLLVTSNLKEYRYELIWQKEQGTDFLNANRKPLKAHEKIQIFYKKLPTYNKQFTEGKNYRAVNGGNKSTDCYGSFKLGYFQSNGTKRNPISVLKFNRERGLHPTQKPVALLEYLIKTYTNKNEIVLDNCIGSGSTAIAAINTGRNFLGFENDEKYFSVAENRIKSTFLET